MFVDEHVAHTHNIFVVGGLLAVDAFQLHALVVRTELVLNVAWKIGVDNTASLAYSTLNAGEETGSGRICGSWRSQMHILR